MKKIKQIKIEHQFQAMGNDEYLTNIFANRIIEFLNEKLKNLKIEITISDKNSLKKVGQKQ